ncbi:MAG: HAMP domain-containing sensor histidine kinase [Bryobacteraceae bacterium]
MTLLDQWLRPPRSLLVGLFLLTLASISTLAWFGWRLLDQERLVEAQHAREHLEQSADRIAATLRGSLAETGDRLGTWLAFPMPEVKPEDGVFLLLAGDMLEASPGGRLLYQPLPSSLPEAAAEAFAEGERLEYPQPKPEQAAAWYARLTNSKDPAVRAGALMRLARVERNSGQGAGAAEAYRQLAAIASAKVAGAPADLAARLALAGLPGRKNDGDALLADLRAVRWQLTRGQFEFYWDAAASVADRGVSPPADAVALTEAAMQLWDPRNRPPAARGQTTLWVDGRPWFAVWRGAPERRALWLVRPEAILQPVLSREAVEWAAADSEGRVVAGRAPSGRHPAVRPAAEGQLPWTLYVGGTPTAGDAGVAARQRFLVAGMGIMVLFLISGTYFIGRAIRREMEVSRMQSDFVSAVSHEFRSPLTSMRQLAEILALGRVPNEDRRQVYYETLVRETGRLQRLVEALLNFGRMEEGARQYHFEELDTATLVERVVAEFEPQIAGQGRHIELVGGARGCTIEADPEAMSVALRNLVDNAIKYSPACPTVWVEWGRQREFVAIRVRDKGVGIQPSERKAIFRKFVRGSAAAEGNVKGSGVGLAMVRHIVAAHGGAIRVASQPGQGSTFTVLLPAMERV